MRTVIRLSLTLSLLGLLVAPVALRAFCGFYVAKADTQLFNRASKVVLVRDGDRTVLTMANDFKGEPKEFALVVPVPTFLERGQIHVGDRAVLDHLDAYTAPRLVEYFDEDPCRRIVYERMSADAAPQPATAVGGAARARSLGVTIEASYTVGEYDILILSAKESDGLETWLTESGYRIPAGASRVLGGYIKQKMRFFVAKVNLEEQSKLGFHYLRPLQVAYESPKFMLPIRLGTVNADGPQELFVFALTRTGRVETTNYRTVRLPSGQELPVYVKEEFADFYRDMFARQVDAESRRAVFLEYAWDMAWCDPCAAEPLSRQELQELGVFWLRDDDRPAARRQRPDPRAGAAGRRRRLRHPPARALRRRDLPRGSGLPGDRRPPELPGSLRAAPPLAGGGDLRGRARLPSRSRRAPRAGGDDAREPHRLEHRRDPAPDPHRRSTAAGRGVLVGAPLGRAPIATSRASGACWPRCPSGRRVRSRTERGRWHAAPSLSAAWVTWSWDARRNPARDETPAKV